MYLLLGWLIVLLFISYNLNGKDFFSPTTMMLLSFIFSCSLSTYILLNIHYSISFQTTMLVGSCMMLSVIIELFSRDVIVQRLQIQKTKDQSTPIPNSFLLFALLVAIVVIFAQLHEIARVAGISGMFSQIMSTYRNAHGYSTDTDAQYPLWLRQMINLLQTLCILYMFNLLKFFRSFKVHVIVMQVVFLFLTVVSSLLTSGRFSILTNLIAGVFMFHMVRIQRLGNYKAYKLGFLIRGILIIIVAAWFFYWSKEFVGRSSEDTLFDYTAHYMGTGVINLDLYLKYPPAKSNIWGKETFYSLINALRRMGVIDVEAYLVHKEFRSIAGISTGNVYTAFRDYLYDFGYIGMYFLHGLFTLIFSIAYEIIKKSRKDLSIIIFSTMYYCTVTYVFSGQFYTNIVSFGFLIKFILLVVFYKILFEKKSPLN